MARSAASTGARSTGGCAEHCWLRGAPSAASPPHPTALEATAGAKRTLRRAPGAVRRRSVASDAQAALRAGCLYVGSGDTTRVRGSCRGFGAQDGVTAPVMTGKTPVRQAKPRPECHGGHPSESDSPGLTRFTPRPPHLRTCPRGASATPRHVHNPKTRPQRSESRAAATTGRAPWAGAGGTLQPRLHQADSGTIATTTRYPTNTRCPPRLTGASALRAPHQSGAGPSEVSGDAGNRTPVRRACNRTSPGAARF